MLNHLSGTVYSTTLGYTAHTTALLLVSDMEPWLPPPRVRGGTLGDENIYIPLKCQLREPEKREPQLRNCLYQIGPVGMSVGAFLDCSLMWGGA